MISNTNIQTMEKSNLAELQSDDEWSRASLIGIEAIFSNARLSNKASSMYLHEVPSYLSIQHSSIITQQLEEVDENLMYSFNCSALWKLLKDKMKKISKIQLLDSSSDKIIIKFVMTFASLLTLNDAKQKVVGKEKQPLRKDIRQHIQERVKTELKRKAAILQQFQKSALFSRMTNELKMSQGQNHQLKSQLADFNLERSPPLLSFLQKCLSYIQRSIQKKDFEIRQKGSAQGLRGDSLGRQTYGVLLLCNYLNLYLAISDWIKILINDKEKKLKQLIFAHITDKKGFQIITRVLEDAPLTAITAEISNFQHNFYK